MHRNSLLLIPFFLPATACSSLGIASPPNAIHGQAPAERPIPARRAAPTATPFGYYAHQGAAFSLTLPPGWEVLTEEEAGASFADHTSGLLFVASSEVEIEETSFDDSILVVLKAMAADFRNIHKVSEGELELAGGVNAHMADVAGQSPKGTQVLIRLVQARQGHRTYRFVVLGLSDAISESRVTLEQVFASLRFLAR